jgi:hypothetical protein
MRRQAAVALATAMALGSGVSAAQVRAGVGFDVGWLVLGGASIRGRPSNPTGGVTFLPHGHVAMAIPGLDWLDAAYVQTPMLVAPFWPEQAGFVDANDLGVVLHTKGRHVSLLLAGTAAPAYALFCNVQWCLREWTWMGGAVGRFWGKVGNTEGRGWHVDATARVLYAQPTAWTWPGLSVFDRAINPLSWMVTGGGVFVF